MYGHLSKQFFYFTSVLLKLCYVGYVGRDDENVVVAGIQTQTYGENFEITF